jgi:hypothetical protein
LGTDLVLIEVSGSRLRADTLVLGDKAKVIEEIDRMVVAKLHQISNCIDALQSGSAIPAEHPTVELGRIRRIWPIVVTAGPLTQNEFLWEHINAPWPGPTTTEGCSAALLDLEEIEALCGMIESGNSLPEILEGKTDPAYRHLELAVWANNAPDAPTDSHRPHMVEERFERATR